MFKTDQKAPALFGDLALLFTASRLALLLTGLLSTWVMMNGVKIQSANLVYHEPASLPLEIWARWDSEWYLLIAEQGYDSSEYFAGLKYRPNATAGFLPLYPLLIRLFGLAFGSVGAGVLVSNLCLMVSLWLLYRLVRTESEDDESGHIAGLAAVAALLVFPTSLFLSAVYSESLFLMLSLIVFERSLKGRFAAAGVAGALAALTRPTGVLLAIPIGVEWWMRRKSSPETSPLSAGWALAPAAGLSLFLVYCGRLFGDPFALMARQERWRGGMSGPWKAFVRYFDEPTAHGTHGSTVELILALFVIALLPVLYRKLRLSYALWATAMVLLPLSSTLWSFGRFALTVFPLFMVIGMGWAGKQKRLVALYGFIGATVSGLFMALFANWWWVG